jgi:hypothetical protein
MRAHSYAPPSYAPPRSVSAFGWPRSGSPSPRMRRPLDPAALLVACLVGVAVVLAISYLTRVGEPQRVMPREEGWRATPWATVSLPSGFQGIQSRGVINAPAGYAPPGIWIGRSGPGLR